MSSNLPTHEEVAKSIDHAILTPALMTSRFLDELNFAHILGVYSVCVRPSDVKRAVSHLEKLGSSTVVSTVAGFPHGNSTKDVKKFEARQAVYDGAVEVDFVLNIADAVNGYFEQVEDEVYDINEAAKKAGASVTKVIFENAYLTAPKIARLSLDLSSTGVDFIKTSTGFAETGATISDVALMMEHKKHQVQVKASGGIKGFADYLDFYRLGVTRFGTSQAQRILTEYETFTETGTIPVVDPNVMQY